MRLNATKADKKEIRFAWCFALVVWSLAAVGAVATTPSIAGVTRSGSSCSLYVSPTGRYSASGRSPGDPTSLRAARQRTKPGTVVCIRGGTYGISSPFYVSRSGAAGKPVVFRSYKGRAVIKWKGSRPPLGSSYAVLQVGSHTHHIAFRGLVIHGANRASSGVKCDTGAHHLVIRGSIIRNTGAAGVITKRCDYVKLLHNLIWHTGYDPNRGWSSGIALNTNVWSDRRASFHNFVIGNVISGASDESSNHTEGHGIILDRGGDVPPVLVANNLVYENGNHCIDVFLSDNAWIVNNTCYKNGLDLRTPQSGEIIINGAGVSNVHVINNVVWAWNPNYPYQLVNGATAAFSHNIAYGGITSQLPERVLANLRQIKPRFRNPPDVDPDLDQQQRTALRPWDVGLRFLGRPTSPLIDGGARPRNMPKRAQYVLRDLRGRLRPRGAGWDIGAYEQ